MGQTLGRVSEIAGAMCRRAAPGCVKSVAGSIAGGRRRQPWVEMLPMQFVIAIRDQTSGRTWVLAGSRTCRTLLGGPVGDGRRSVELPAGVRRGDAPRPGGNTACSGGKEDGVDDVDHAVVRLDVGGDHGHVVAGGVGQCDRSVVGDSDGDGAAVDGGDRFAVEAHDVGSGTPRTTW